MDFRRRLIIFIGVNLGIILVAGIVLYYFVNRIGRDVNAITLDRQDLYSRTNINETLASLRKNSEIAEQYAPELDNLLPTRDQLINFSQDLGLIGNQNKVNLTASLAEENAGAGSKLTSVNFIMTLQGKFDDLVNTLKTIKNSRYITSNRSLDLARQGGDNFRLTINGQVFSFQP